MIQSKQKFVYYFKAILDTDFVGRAKEKPYREIAVLSSQSLSTLAKAIVKSFGFDFDHCYGFYDNVRNPNLSKEIFELFTDLPDVEHTEGARGITYVKVPKAFTHIGKTMGFLFDYGDNWWFTVELADIKPSVKNTNYPKVLKRVGKAPEQYPDLDGDDLTEKDAKMQQFQVQPDLLIKKRQVIY